MNFGWNYVTGRREFERGAVTIYDYERGLFYKNGQLIRVLEAGRYRLWPWQHARIEVVDVRRQSAQIVNQKLLTSDQITVSLNMVADYEIADVKLATQKVMNYASQLHEDVQLAARNIVGAITVDEILQKRAEINAQLQEAIVAKAAEYGLRVLAVGIKDVILAPKVRDLLMKEAEAKRVAQAMLIGAREEAKFWWNGDACCSTRKVICCCDVTANMRERHSRYAGSIPANSFELCGKLWEPSGFISLI